MGSQHVPHVPNVFPNSSSLNPKWFALSSTLAKLSRTYILENWLIVLWWANESSDFSVEAVHETCKYFLWQTLIVVLGRTPHAASLVKIKIALAELSGSKKCSRTKYEGSSFVAASFKAEKLNDRSARQVCSHLHLVHAVCQQRKVRQFADWQFADFREIIHFSNGH